MNLREAKAQVEREQPELKGTARLEAIKALRDQPEATPPANGAPSGPAGPAASEDAFCRNCAQAVKPQARNGWGKFFTFIALLQVAAVIVSVVACFTTVDAGGGAIRRLATWPAAIHPIGLGVAAAVAALIAAIAVAGELTQRAERHGTCPKCKSVLATQSAG